MTAVREAAKVIQEAAGNVLYESSGDKVKNEQAKNDLLTKIDTSMTLTQLPQKSQKIVRKAMLLAESFGIKTQAVPDADFYNPNIVDRAEYTSANGGTQRQNMVYMSASSGIGIENANVGRNAVYSAYSGGGPVGGTANAEGDAFYNNKITEMTDSSDGNILSSLTTLSGIISKEKGRLATEISNEEELLTNTKKDRDSVMKYYTAELALNRKTLGELGHEKKNRLSDQKITQQQKDLSTDNLRIVSQKCLMEDAAYEQRSTVQGNEVSVLTQATNTLKTIVNMDSVPGLCGCTDVLNVQCVLCSWGYSATPKVKWNLCCTDAFDEYFEGGDHVKKMTNKFTNFQAAAVVGNNVKNSASCRAFWNPGAEFTSNDRCQTKPEYLQIQSSKAAVKSSQKKSAAMSFAHFQKEAVMNLLQGAAQSIHGKELLNIVQVINATRATTPDDLDFGDVFNSVKQLIKKMIDRLQKTSASDVAELKGDIQTDQEWKEWCDSQIAESDAGRKVAWTKAFEKNVEMDTLWNGQAGVKQMEIQLDGLQQFQSKLHGDEVAAVEEESQQVATFTSAKARLDDLKRTVENAKSELDRFYGAGALSFRGHGVAATDTSSSTTLRNVDVTTGSENHKVKHWKGKQSSKSRSDYEGDGAAVVGEAYNNEAHTDYEYDNSDVAQESRGYSGIDSMAVVIDVLQDAINDLGKETSELLSERTQSHANFIKFQSERGTQNTEATQTITTITGSIAGSETAYRAAAGVFVKNLVKVEGYGYDLKGLRRGCGNVWMKFSEKQLQRSTMCKELSRVLCMLGKSTVTDLGACSNVQCKYSVLTVA